MTQHRSNPATPKAPIEAKVKAATAATYLGLVVLLAFLNGVSDSNLIGELPDLVEVLVAPVLPAAITLVAGYVTRHTPRDSRSGRYEN